MAAASAKSRKLWAASVGEGEEKDAEQFSDFEGSDGDSEEGKVRLKVKTSLIPNAGDGLFLASSDPVEEETVLLKEAAVSLKRPEAKVVLQDPVWCMGNPVIQLNGNKYLDIRKVQSVIERRFFPL
mmetsp:Transcript_4559/g.10732  ORF Transcript_4559/g.10732 Transcript_4559/m.10732 type:complete len:126 (+) Transcript_4559:21-398(+)|eukprot:CAMPEP_0172615882 /NCGR_PEP_ID=MMETSP1068-20121228/62569_1 /TAXON_ID=35684 /ORGANISM="Pseudopedinella elastica, Strain CCMP716" /LENGTH=125 /DNA_ID=CAMNT_0013421167 /DNA_START=19 /DNA_END=396 /DNA_ORIENTATION=-